MEGYRTSLILAAPEFDTYRCIERFAASPDMISYMAFNALLRRTRLRVEWDVCMNAHSRQALGWTVARRTGARVSDPEPDGSVPASDLASMTDAQRLDFYKQCCKAAGMDVDPAALVDIENRIAAKE